MTTWPRGRWRGARDDLVAVLRLDNVHVGSPQRVAKAVYKGRLALDEPHHRQGRRRVRRVDESAYHCPLDAVGVGTGVVVVEVRGVLAHGRHLRDERVHGHTTDLKGRLHPALKTQQSRSARTPATLRTFRCWRTRKSDAYVPPVFALPCVHCG